MAKRFLLLHCLFILVLFFVPRGNASAEERVIFDHITVMDGLVDNHVSGIVQDRNGYLWFGTQNGLNRYDGKSFRIYDNQPFNPNSLPHNQIQTLFLDPQYPYLWIGTYEGLSRMSLETEEFLNFTSDPTRTEDPISDGIVIAIAKTPDGAIWVGTMNGLNRIDPDSFEVTAYFHSDSDQDSLLHDTVRSLLVDKQGRLWVGSYGGLDLFEPDTERFIHFTAEKGNPRAFQSFYVMALAEAPSGALWVGTWDGGVSLFDPDTGVVTEQIPLDENVYLLCPGEDSLWIGTWGGGLFNRRYSDGSMILYDGDSEDPYKMNHGIVYSFLRDRTGLYWIGTNGGGINILNPNKKDFRFISQNSEYPLVKDVVRKILIDSNGDFWIGTYSNGVWRIPGANSSSTYKHWMPSGEPGTLAHRNISAMTEDSAGNIWVGSLGGLDRYNQNTGEFDHFSLRGMGFDDNLEPIIYEIVEDQDGTFWIGTYSSGVLHWTPEKGILKRYFYDENNPSLSNNLVNTILLDHQGGLWVGTNRGLNRYDRGADHFETFYHDSSNPASLSSNYIGILFEDSSQNLWIGTDGGGLNRYSRQNHSFSSITRQDGLASNQILSILEDSRNQLWIGTKGGVNILQSGSMDILTIDSSDGIMVHSLNSGAASDDDHLYFGSQGGVLRFEPTILMDNTTPPILSFNDIQVMGESIAYKPYLKDSHPLELPWDQNALNFEFIALDFTSPEKNLYRFRMEGLEEDWVSSSNRNYASYSNLKPGKYRFLVEGANNDGIWSEETLAFPIVINQPPWKQKWFILIYIFIGVLLFILFSNFQANLLLKKKLHDAESSRQNLEVLNSRLEELAWKDSLTGLANRRFFDLSLSNLWHLAAREQKHLAMLMIDVDFFKNYNDCYGHQKGDSALKETARIIRSIIRRESDAVCRYGGEEFSVLLFDMPLGDALTLCEALLEKIRQAAIPHEESSAAPYLTVSIGLTGLIPRADRNPGSLVKAADKALYKAKSHGRNRVEYSNPIEMKEDADEQG